VDRWLQQAVSQVLMTKYELTFGEHSYGFRPEKNIHKAVTQALKNINDGYQDIVDIDLKGFPAYRPAGLTRLTIRFSFN